MRDKNGKLKKDVLIAVVSGIILSVITGLGVYASASVNDHYLVKQHTQEIAQMKNGAKACRANIEKNYITTHQLQKFELKNLLHTKRLFELLPESPQKDALLYEMDEIIFSHPLMQSEANNN